MAIVALQAAALVNMQEVVEDECLQGSSGSHDENQHRQ